MGRNPLTTLDRCCAHLQPLRVDQGSDGRDPAAGGEQQQRRDFLGRQGCQVETLSHDRAYVDRVTCISCLYRWTCNEGFAMRVLRRGYDAGQGALRSSSGSASGPWARAGPRSPLCRIRRTCRAVGQHLSRRAGNTLDEQLHEAGVIGVRRRSNGVETRLAVAHLQRVRTQGALGW